MRNFEKLSDEKVSVVFIDIHCFTQRSSFSAYNDNWYRMRIRSLQAVDEMVEAIYKKVEAAGALDNTSVRSRNSETGADLFAGTSFTQVC